MSNWNYRVVDTEKGFAVFKVYYDSLGQPVRRDDMPVMDAFSPSVCGLTDYLESVQLAFEKKTLRFETSDE